MFPSGHVVGLLQAAYHIGLLPLRSITSKNCELVERYAVLKQLGGLHMKSLVLGSVQPHPGVISVDLPTNTVSLNLGVAC